MRGNLSQQDDETPITPAVSYSSVNTAEPIRHASRAPRQGLAVGLVMAQAGIWDRVDQNEGDQLKLPDLTAESLVVMALMVRLLSRGRRAVQAPRGRVRQGMRDHRGASCRSCGP